MKIATFLTAITICGIFTLTGCAAKKEFTNTDMTQPTTASTAAATVKSTPSPASGEQAASGAAMTDASIAAEDLAKAGKAAEQIDAAQAKGLDTVYFDFDAHLLSAEARDTLTRNAGYLKESPLTRVIIEGHADERGSDDYNLALAEKRAIAARRYIEALGVSQDRLEIISYGEDKPAVTGQDEAAWAKNRRVDFVGGK